MHAALAVGVEGAQLRSSWQSRDLTAVSREAALGVVGEYSGEVSHKPVGREKSDLAWLRAGRQANMPNESSVNKNRVKHETDACLWFAPPVRHVFQIASTTQIDVLSGFYEHIICRNNIDKGWVAWMVERDP